jgi:hypothetical protein
MNHFLKNSAVFYWQKCVLKNRNIGPWPKRKKNVFYHFQENGTTVSANVGQESAAPCNERKET